MSRILPDERIVVAGAGGFIGGHLVRDLRARGVRNVRAIDVKPLDEWHQVISGVENRVADLRESHACADACEGMDWVFNLACDMGGIGFIETNKAACMVSVLINTHLLMAAQRQGVRGFFFASSACVYAAERQTTPDVVPLKESDAYPAMPEDGYGWEKLFSERMCRHFYEDFGMKSSVARFHNVYGPFGTYEGGREKAPAAICRKVIEAKLNGRSDIEVWGDGEQTRSFMYIDDCLTGIHLLTERDVREPTNLGSAELVSINQLVDIVEGIAGLRLSRRYRLDAPKGVRGRSSDNTRVRELLSWEPSTALREGIEETYRWIYDQMAKRR